MDERERIRSCIHFKEVDSIPWQINYTTEIARKIMDSLKLQKLSYPLLEKNIYEFNSLDDYFGNHIIYLRNRAVNSLKEVEPDMWMDEWGVLWDRRIDKDIGTPANRLLEDRDLGKICVPDPLNIDRFAHFKPTLEANPYRYIIVKISFCLFERAWALRGMENLLMDFKENPSFVHELFEILTNFNLAVIKNLVNYQIDGVQFGDDWGGQGGLLMSPDTWREFIKPHLKKMFAQAHLQGYDVFIHSCGKITSILDDLVEIGLNVYNPFQPEVMNIEEIIDRYSRRLAFYGGLSIQKTLPFGKPEDVLYETRHRLRLARRYGGFIISPAHDMPPDIPLKNVLSMLEVFKMEN